MLLQKCKNFYNNILFKGVHVERQVVKFAFEVGNRIQSEAVKIHELVHKIPHFPTFSMEDMRAIFVNIDTLNILTIHISSDMAALVDNKTTLPCLSSKVGESGTE